MKNDGGPAFPFWESKFAESPNESIRTGMSLRDWFAGMAMQALATGLNWQPGRIVHSEDELAQDAYGIADAMIEQRDKKD